MHCDDLQCMTQVEKFDETTQKNVNYLYYATRMDEGMFYRVKISMS